MERAMRTWDERLHWLASPAAHQIASRGNQCLRTQWSSFGGLPALGFGSAIIAAERTRSVSGLKTSPPPVGALLWWGGTKYGHVATMGRNKQVISTDVHGLGTVGEVQFGWFAEHWPAIKYWGWSDHYAHVSFDVEPGTVHPAAHTSDPEPQEHTGVRPLTMHELHQGYRDVRVGQLQRALATATGDFNFWVGGDGVYGPKTAKHLSTYAKAHGENLDSALESLRRLTHRNF